MQEPTELDRMLEMHATDPPPPGYGGSHQNNAYPSLPPQQAEPPKQGIDYAAYAAYAAHWGSGFDPKAARMALSVSMPPNQAQEPVQPPNPEDTMKAIAEAVPEIDSNAEAINKAEAEKSDDVDPEELAMLGIDPSDFAGFGK